MGFLPEPLAGLVRDHHVVEDLVRDVRRALSAAGPGSDAGARSHALDLVRDLSAFAEFDLAVHIAKEEDVLFPAVRDHAKAEVEALLVDMFAQHDEIRDRNEEIAQALRAIDADHDELLDNISQLRAGLEAAGATASDDAIRRLYATVRILDDLFQAHFWDEESSLFEPAVKWFSPELMAELAAGMTALEARSG